MPQISNEPRHSDLKLGAGTLLIFLGMLYAVEFRGRPSKQPRPEPVASDTERSDAVRADLETIDYDENAEQLRDLASKVPRKTRTKPRRLTSRQQRRIDQMKKKAEKTYLDMWPIDSKETLKELEKLMKLHADTKIGDDIKKLLELQKKVKLPK